MEILIFEDNKNWQEMWTELVNSNVKDALIKVAGDIVEANELIEKSAISAKVALVDGNLDSSLSGRDGRHIEGLLRAKNPNIFIVEVSAFGNALLTPNSVFRKREINNQEAVTSLFEKLNALKS